LRRAAVVRRLSTGVLPSNTNTGRTRWNSSLRRRVKSWGAAAGRGAGGHGRGGGAAPADPAEEAEQVRVVNDLAPLVPHRRQELVQPDGGIYAHTPGVISVRAATCWRW